MDDQRYERELRAELAGLLDPVVGSHPRWDASPAAERSTGVPARPWRSSRAGLLWAALLGLMLLVALFASALFVGGQPVDDEGTSAWTSIEFPDAGGVSDVIETPSGYLAVGWAEPEHGSIGAAWTSTDCLDWERVPMGNAAISPDLDAVAYAGGTYVATVPGRQPSLRLSLDGRIWERVMSEVMSDGRIVGPLMANDLIALGDRFVAIGGWGGTDTDPVTFWWSTDGRSWREVTDVDPSPTGLASLESGENPWGWAMFDTGSALAASESGLFAAGTSGRGEAVWRSTDGGSSWARVLGDDQATFRALWDIAISPDGVIVAVGSGSVGGEPVVWWSPDGTTWSMVADMGPFEAPQGPTEYDGVTWLRPEVSLDSISWAGDRFFVLGSEGGPGADIPVIWTSTDGQTWSREAPDPTLERAEPWHVFVCGDHVLLTGSAHEPLTGWARPIDSFAAAGPKGG